MTMRQLYQNRDNDRNELTFPLHGAAFVDAELQRERQNNPKRAGMSDELAGSAVGIQSALLRTLIRMRARGLLGFTWACLSNEEIETLVFCHVERQRSRSGPQSLCSRLAPLSRC